MDFKEFKNLFQDHVYEMFKDQEYLFVMDVDKDAMWNLYLDSFPPGTNEVFRKRREYDCAHCRHFIKSFGNVVAIKDHKIITVWDFETGESEFQPVITALSKFVISSKIADVFLTNEKHIGINRNFNEEYTIIWDHFYINLPSQFVIEDRRKTVPSIIGEYRDVRNVFKRSLEEITKDSIETVLDLIAQNSLYKGEEWRSILNKFLKLQNEYNQLSDSEKEIFCWTKSLEVGGSIGKIRNHSIGVLLINISQGMELDIAVRKYEAIVAPQNYKRPNAIFTKKMLEQAQKKLADLGLLNSLARRFAVIDDITINNVLFANRDSIKHMKGNVFDELMNETTGNAKKYDRVEEVPIDIFIENILPRTTSLELFLENRHSPNMVSLIAPVDGEAPSLLKWENNFSWWYNGNVADSMKERVKAAGGKIDGVLRFSIQWNEDGDNNNDFDAHCIEPDGNEIYFTRKRGHSSTGMLDVDIINPKEHCNNGTAVENITWSQIEKMQEGTYNFFVYTYSYRGGKSGFRAEIEYNGEIYSFENIRDSRTGEKVNVATINFDRKNGIKFIKSMPSTSSSKKLWNLDSNQFHPVSVCMYSPNFWDANTGVGNKHYMFMLKGCVNDQQPNGFFNEFLKTDLLEHKKVFEALGSKMHVQSSDDQLSGLGFSSTQHNSVICKLIGLGNVERIINIIF